MLATYALATAVTLQGAAGSAKPASSFYNFNLRSIDGAIVQLSRYKGQVLLVVNVASACGYTPQYAGMQAVYQKYQKQGLVVLGIPSNSFKQETGSDAEIKAFCTGKYKVTFPMFAKIDVAGKNPHPFYKWLVQASADTNPVEWNFTKFLVSRNGTVLKRFPSKVAADSAEVVKAIESALKAPQAGGMSSNPGGGRPTGATTRP